MIRIVRLSHQYYGLDMGEITSYGGDLDTVMEDLLNFIDSGDPVLLVNSLDDIEHIIPGFNLDDLIMVDKNDEE